MKGGAVASPAPPLELAPRGLAFDGGVQQFGVEVRDTRKDRGPVLPDLSVSSEGAVGMGGLFAQVIRREARDKRLDVVRVLRRDEARENLGWVPVHARSRSLYRWILPVTVFGSSGTNSIQRGYL